MGEGENVRGWVVAAQAGDRAAFATLTRDRVVPERMFEPVAPEGAEFGALGYSAAC